MESSTANFLFLPLTLFTITNKLKALFNHLWRRTKASKDSTPFINLNQQKTNGAVRLMLFALCKRTKWNFKLPRPFRRRGQKVKQVRDGPNAGVHRILGVGKIVNCSYPKLVMRYEKILPSQQRYQSGGEKRWQQREQSLVTAEKTYILAESQRRRLTWRQE